MLAMASRNGRSGDGTARCIFVARRVGPLSHHVQRRAFPACVASEEARPEALRWRGSENRRFWDRRPAGDGESGKSSVLDGDAETEVQERIDRGQTIMRAGRKDTDGTALVVMAWDNGVMPSGWGRQDTGIAISGCAQGKAVTEAPHEP
jgi:hypothetical protein